MELGQTHKVEFKMRSTYTTKKRGRLLQVKLKWCGEFSRDNLKHKIYTALNLWKETPFPSLYNTMCFSARTTSKRHFSLRVPSASPKTRILVLPKLWKFISFSNKVFFFLKCDHNILYPLKLSFQQCITHSNQTSFDPSFQGICDWKSNSQFDSRPYFSS